MAVTTKQTDRMEQRNIADILAAGVDHPSMLTLAQSDVSVPVGGAKVNDIVNLGLPAAPTAGIVYQAFVSAANTVKIRATNTSGGTIDPAAATFRIQVLRLY